LKLLLTLENILENSDNILKNHHAMVYFQRNWFLFAVLWNVKTLNSRMHCAIL